MPHTNETEAKNCPRGTHGDNSRILENEIGTLLADHDGRSIGVGTRDLCDREELFDTEKDDNRVRERG
jgi:hypothetical protein